MATSSPATKPWQRGAALLGLMVLVNLGGTFCLCAEPAEVPTASCHEPAPAPSPVDYSLEKPCCCSAEVSAAVPSLEPRSTQPPVGHSLWASLAPTDASVARDLRTRSDLWLTGASPPRSPPPAFLLPLRI